MNKYSKKNADFATAYPADRAEWIELLGTNPQDKTLEHVGISRKTWVLIFKGKSPMVSTASYRLARFTRHCALDDLAGPDWHGFAIHGKTLIFPGLKYPLAVESLRSTWFSLQELGMLRANNALLTRDLERMQQAIDESELNARFWRNQCRLESRAGLMLAGMISP